MTEAYKPSSGTTSNSTAGITKLADQAKNISKDLKTSGDGFDRYAYAVRPGSS